MMRLFQIAITISFLCLLIGAKDEQLPVKDKIYSEMTTHQTQVSSDLSDFILTPDWLHSYLFILNICDPVKQLDLPVDHDKTWNHLHGRMLRSASRAEMAMSPQVRCISKYWRLLSDRYTNGFYLYTLEKLLI